MMETVEKMFADLTVEHVLEWAGEKIYSRGEDYVTRVSNLSRTAKGSVAAWVAGTYNYATTVGLDTDGNLEAWCSCPYSIHGPCKHAVAVLLAAADRLKRRKKLPLLSDDDELQLELQELVSGEIFDEDFEDRDDMQGAYDTTAEEITQILSGKTREGLEQMLIRLAREIPEAARRIIEMERMTTGQVDAIARALRREIRELTAKEVWYDSWEDEGNVPDYSHLTQQLRVLAEAGHADLVFELGGELWQRGQEQVAMADDDGATSEEISLCMEVVLKTLPDSQMSLPEQLLWVIDREGEDEYGMLPDCKKLYTDYGFSQEQWLEAIEVLGERLALLPSTGRSSHEAPRRRQQLLDWLVLAHRQAGRLQEVVPLLEREVEFCENYQQLVDILVWTGERERARLLCITGYRKTRQDKPGIAASLHRRLRRLAEDEGRFDLASSYRAEDFFEAPSESTFFELQRSAEQAGVWSEVRQAAIAYLQTGVRPDKRGKTDDWPLMAPEVKTDTRPSRFYTRQFPAWSTLLDIALLEARIGEAVAVYHEAPKDTSWAWGVEERLADAVRESHPDVALGIWRTLADAHIAKVKPSSYLDAAKYLRLMRAVYENTGRTDDWRKLVGSLRTVHVRKRRLLEVLNRLESNKRLID